jgi:hypothetical protein
MDAGFAAAASADAGREATAKVAAPTVPRKRRRDNRERNEIMVPMAVPTIDCYMQEDVVLPGNGTTGGDGGGSINPAR